MSLKDQVVLVTGSSGGIGNAAVEALTPQGPSSSALIVPPKRDRPWTRFYPLDITSEQQCAAAVQDITSKYGRIDVLVHAAGVLGTTPGIMETTTEEFDSIMRINASATFSYGAGNRQIDACHRYGRRHRGPVLRCSQRSPPQLPVL